MAETAYRYGTRRTGASGGRTRTHNQHYDPVAVGALATGILGFNLIAILLGAWSIHRINDDLTLKGKWMAVTGIILGAFWAIVIAVLILAGIGLLAL